MVTEKPTMASVARDMSHTLTISKYAKAADAIAECLEYNPDYVESWDASDEQADFADSYCSIYYSDAIKWYADTPNSDDYINQYYSDFGPDLLRADSASSIIVTLITGGQYIEAYRLWDEVWDMIKDKYDELVADWPEDDEEGEDE